MSQDDIDASRAPLMDHLIELRARLIKALIAFPGDVLHLLLLRAHDLQCADLALCARRRLAGEREAYLHGPASNTCSRRSSSPCSALPFSRFRSSRRRSTSSSRRGSTRTSARRSCPTSPRTPVFFAIGAAVVYFIAMPLVMRFSIGQQQLAPGEAPIVLLPKVSEYLSLIMTLIFAFGITFQFARHPHPDRPGRLDRFRVPEGEATLCDRRHLHRRRPSLTPPDVISQLSLAVPTLLLYEGSILAVRMVEKRQAAAAAASGASSVT